MLDAKNMFGSLTKIPIIGDFILAFGIVVILTTLSSAGGYFGLKGEDKELLINVYTYIGIIYFFLALTYRIYIFITKKTIK